MRAAARVGPSAGLRWCLSEQAARRRPAREGRTTLWFFLGSGGLATPLVRNRVFMRRLTWPCRCRMYCWSLLLCSSNAVQLSRSSLFCSFNSPISAARCRYPFCRATAHVSKDVRVQGHSHKRTGRLVSRSG